MTWTTRQHETNRFRHILREITALRWELERRHFQKALSRAHRLEWKAQLLRERMDGIGAFRKDHT